MTPLTPTEQRVVRLLSEGLTDKEIAEKLGCATGTIKKHGVNIRLKIQRGNRLQTVLWWRDEGQKQYPQQ